MNLKNLNPFTTDIDVYYGERMNLDSLHAEMLEGDLVSRIPVDSAQHVISLQLRDSGELQKIIDAALIAPA
jgi:hypothetical protein